MKKVVFCRMFLGFILILLSSCVGEIYETSQSLIKSSEFQNEKKIFEKRLGGKHLCPDIGVSDLIISDNLKPSKDCLYPSSKFVINYDNLFAGAELRQSFNTLKVIQVIPSGFIINAEYFDNRIFHKTSSDRISFIVKSDEQDVVDGEYLDPNSNWNLYEYKGVHHIDSRTVHSFRKISNKELLEHKKDLKIYGVFKEFFIEKGLWTLLKKIDELKK